MKPDLKIQFSLTLQEVADIRHLLSIAVWVRSEQLSAEETIFLLSTKGPVTDLPPVALNKDNLHIENAMEDLKHGQKLWRKFHDTLKGLDSVTLKPSWQK